METKQLKENSVLELILKVAQVCVIPLCVFFYNLVDKVDDKVEDVKRDYVKNAQLDAVEKRITENIGNQVKSLDNKLDILLDRQARK